MLVLVLLHWLNKYNSLHTIKYPNRFQSCKIYKRLITRTMACTTVCNFSQYIGTILTFRSMTSWLVMLQLLHLPSCSLHLGTKTLVHRHRTPSQIHHRKVMLQFPVSVWQHRCFWLVWDVLMTMIVFVSCFSRQEGRKLVVQSGQQELFQDELVLQSISNLIQSPINVPRPSISSLIESPGELWWECQ